MNGVCAHARYRKSDSLATSLVHGALGVLRDSAFPVCPRDITESTPFQQLLQVYFLCLDALAGLSTQSINIVFHHSKPRQDGP